MYMLKKHIPVFIDSDKKIFFFSSPKRRIEYLNYTDDDIKILKRLIQGSKLSNEDLKSDIFQLLSDNNLLNSKSVEEEDSILNRSNSFLKLLDFDNINLDKHILILGLGGLGSKLLEDLIKVGFNNFTIVDGDIVEKSNLNRSSIFNGKLGYKKIDAIKNYYSDSELNVRFNVINDYLNQDNLQDIINKQVDYCFLSFDPDIELQNQVKSRLKNLKIPFNIAFYGEEMGQLGPHFIPKTSSCIDCFNKQIDNNYKYEIINKEFYQAPSSILIRASSGI